MKDVTDVFIISDRGLLEINKIELRGIQEFRDVLERDRGGVIKGDSQGRKKWLTLKEFMYVHLFHHPASIYRDLPDEARHLKAIEDCGLPESWKVDAKLKKAIKKYKEILNMSATYHTYINANRGVYSLGEDLKFFNNLREKTRKKIEEKYNQLEGTVNGEERQNLEAEIDYATNRLMEIGNKITTISNSLPVAYDTIEKLKQKLLKETDNTSRVYGGGELGNREK